MLNFTKKNYSFLIIGVFILVLGYITLAWDTNDIHMNAYAFHKLTVAPLLLTLGYVFIGVGIFIKDKKQHV